MWRVEGVNSQVCRAPEGLHRWEVASEHLHVKENKTKVLQKQSSEVFEVNWNAQLKPPCCLSLTALPLFTISREAAGAAAQTRQDGKTSAVVLVVPPDHSPSAPQAATWGMGHPLAHHPFPSKSGGDLPWVSMGWVLMRFAQLCPKALSGLMLSVQIYKLDAQSDWAKW